MRIAYDKYLEDLLGLVAQNADEIPSDFIPKKLYSLIKKKQDKSHRESLYDKKESTLVTENKAFKFTISVSFSQLYPLCLGQLCDKIPDP